MLICIGDGIRDSLIYRTSLKLYASAPPAKNRLRNMLETSLRRRLPLLCMGLKTI